MGRIWFIDQLCQQGLIGRVITRPKLPGENHTDPTTYPESHNLRLGLEALLKAYGEQEVYVIGQTADVLPKPGAYRYLDDLVHGKTPGSDD